MGHFDVIVTFFDLEFLLQTDLLSTKLKFLAGLDGLIQSNPSSDGGERQCPAAQVKVGIWTNQLQFHNEWAKAPRKQHICLFKKKKLSKATSRFVHSCCATKNDQFYKTVIFILLVFY